MIDDRYLRELMEADTAPSGWVEDLQRLHNHTQVEGFDIHIGGTLAMVRIFKLVATL